MISKGLGTCCRQEHQKAHSTSGRPSGSCIWRKFHTAGPTSQFEHTHDVVPRRDETQDTHKQSLQRALTEVKHAFQRKFANIKRTLAVFEERIEKLEYRSCAHDARVIDFDECFEREPRPHVVGARTTAASDVREVVGKLPSENGPQEWCTSH